MVLTFLVEKGILITDQPSAPRQERTPFKFDGSGRLCLENEGHPVYYVRSPESESVAATVEGKDAVDPHLH